MPASVEGVNFPAEVLLLHALDRGLLCSAQWSATVLNTVDAAEELSKVTVTPPGDWTSQLRRGVLELCILRLLRHRPSYGYEIVTTLDAFGPLAAGENTVYPLLRRLKADHYLETFTRESPAGPPRRYYRLTPGRPASAWGN